MEKETYQDGLKRILPTKVFELAIKNTHHKRRAKIIPVSEDYNILVTAFNWNNTKEGLDFWFTEWLKCYKNWRNMKGI